MSVCVFLHLLSDDVVQLAPSFTLRHTPLQPMSMLWMMFVTYILPAGFVASGPLVVLAEAALRMGPQPSHIQQLILFQLVAGLTLAGAALPVSLVPHATS